MSQNLRRLAIALWLVSFVLPTTTLHSGAVAIGAEVALQGLAGIAVMFPIGLLGKPFQVISLLSNLLVVGELRQQLGKLSNPHSLGRTFLLVSVTLLNVAIGWHVKPFFPDILSHPGFYLWAASFVLLASAGVYENKLFFLGLLKRSLALGAVSTVVFLVGLAAIFFVR